MDDINSYGKSIGTIIIAIVFLVSLIIIIDEIYNITKFVYRYTYLYNYGSMYEKTCFNDTIEYDKARFKIYNEINKYILKKDIFNKTWVNYIYYLIIFILSILICIAFGYLLYELFINSNDLCKSDKPKSTLQELFNCIFGSDMIPNCFVNYIIIFIIIFIYPLIYILKVGIKFDLTWSAGYYTRLFHIFVFIMLCYYIYEIVIIKSDTKFSNLSIYILFMIIFYLSNYLFNKTFEDFNNITKIANIYKDDETFYDIYKQEEPLKPAELVIPPIVAEFKSCKESDFSSSNNKYCNKFIDQATIAKYKEDELEVKNYHNNLKTYEKEMEIYKNKYNIYKNNKTEFPEIVTFIQTMFPKLLGINKREIQILFILLIVIVILSYYLKSNDNKYYNYVYYTIFLYVIGLLSIIILINAILIYNTYLNKYLIYEPLHNYKNIINKLNNVFLYNLTEDISVKEFINKIDSKLYDKINISTSSSDVKLIEEQTLKNIKEFNNLITESTDSPIINSSNIDNIKKIQLNFYKTIESFINNKEILNISSSNLNTYYLTTKIIIDSTNYKSRIPLFFINNERNIEKTINELKVNLDYFMYNSPIQADLNYRLDNKTYTKKQVNKTKEKEKDVIIINYNRNLSIIDKAFEIYGTLLKEFRIKTVELLNTLEISCNYNDNILIEEKILELGDKLDKANSKNLLVYNKIIEMMIKDLNKILIVHFNQIKYYMRQIKFNSTASNINTTVSEIIKIYNINADELNKHNDSSEFIKELIKLNCTFIPSKYNKMDSTDYKKLDISSTSVSWSFIILIIIFTVILLEPIIV